MKIFKYVNMIILLVPVLIVINAHGLSAGNDDGLKIGTKLSAFSALDENGNVWHLKDHLKNGFLVIYFYPAALTSGCTKQACNVRDQRAELAKLKTAVVGISGDKVENLRYFKNMHQLNFTLLSDSSGTIANMFAVPVKKGGTIQKEIDGNKMDLVRYGTFSRWTYIIDKNGTVLYKNTAVNASTDIDEIIAFIRKQK